MSIEKLLQNFANATGIVTDRTFTPPRILGQAFLVSKSRMVTCAGCIFNYAESPWALAINFPHPDAVLGVKTMALHPEFDRKEARTAYLNQTASSTFSYPVQFNDLATMVVHAELKDPDPELVGQLHRALSLPFSSDGVTASGTVHGNEFEEVVKKILDSKQSGLITLFDELNIPIAYLQITVGTIERVYFRGIAGEMAFAELIYRQPGNGYSFRPNQNFTWGDLRKIEISTDNLIAESVKRASEIPAMLNSLGGPQARYQKVVKEFSSGSFNESVQWLINNLWQTIDGYTTLDQLSERVGADTYTAVQGLRELSNQGVISLINRQTPFHSNGQLGMPIVSHTDFDINPGDTLKAFYLDPLSGAPCWQDGNFAGVSSVLQPKNLLHSIPIRLKVPGALILKNYKLIGVHNGAVQVKPGQTSMERQLYQMMWIGALFDMSAKKLRSSTEFGEGSESADSATISGTKFASLRDRDNVEENGIEIEKLQTYVCTKCFAANTKLGNCFNCGALIEAPLVEPKKQGFFTTTIRIKAISDLQAKYQITDRQLFITGGVGLAAMLLLVIVIIMSNSVSTGPPAVSVNKADNKNAAQAVQLAVSVVGFKGIAPPGYWFADTSNLTSPLPSFGLLSDSNNQKVLFVVFNDMSPVQALDRFIQIPPFSDVVASPTQDEWERSKIAAGSQILGADKFNYFVYNYLTAGNAKKNMLVGSFPAKEAGKGILVIGQALQEGTYDYKSTLFLLDTMAESLTAAANAKLINSVAPKESNPLKEPPNLTASKTSSSGQLAEAPDNKLASDDEINKYCQDLQEKLHKKIDLEKDLQDEVKKAKTGKPLKIVLEVDINSSGNLQKMEISEPDSRQKTNDDLVKIISSLAPYTQVPKTENGLLSLRLVFKNGKLTIERRDI